MVNGDTRTFTEQDLWGPTRVRLISLQHQQRFYLLCSHTGESSVWHHTTTGYPSGDILVSNVLLGSDLKAAVVHVGCFGFHIEEFTVLQNLYFATMLIYLCKHFGAQRRRIKKGFVSSISFRRNILKDDNKSSDNSGASDIVKII